MTERDRVSADPSPDTEPSGNFDTRGMRTMAEDHDFRGRTKPTLFYAIASTPRSGSTLLARLLWATGAMGAPTEYFNYEGPMLRMVARLRPRNLAEYAVQLLQLRTSPNGVFGFKAHWDQFQLVRNGGLLGFFPGLRFIHIERTDRLAQAVSMVRAQQTGQWESSVTQKFEPTYDPARIRYWLRRIDEEAAAWQALLRHRRVQPITIAYDALAADPDGAVDGILQRFRLTRAAPPPVQLPEMRRQSDSLNREWIERFRRENPDLGAPRA